MGVTVREAIEQARSQYLQPGNLNQEEVAFQEGSLNTSATTMTLEETVAIPDGEIIEWDDSTFEIGLVKDQTTTTVTFASRGYLDTTGETHADGTRLIIGSVYPKKILYDALQAVISSLRGYGLYVQAYTSALTINTTAPVQLPTGATGVVSVLYQNGSQWFPIDANGYRLLRNYSGVDSAPAMQFFTGIQGAATRIVYKKDYTLPEDVTLGGGETRFDVDLEDECFLPGGIARSIAKGMAALVLEGRDIPQTDLEHVRLANAQQSPVGTRINLGRSLWTSFLTGPVQAERNRLIETNPVSITYERY